jgi:hypothetical protein
MTDDVERGRADRENTHKAQGAALACAMARREWFRAAELVFTAAEWVKANPAFKNEPWFGWYWEAANNLFILTRAEYMRLRA